MSDGPLVSAVGQALVGLQNGSLQPTSQQAPAMTTLAAPNYPIRQLPPGAFSPTTSALLQQSLPSLFAGQSQGLTPMNPGTIPTWPPTPIVPQAPAAPVYSSPLIGGGVAPSGRFNNLAGMPSNWGN